MHPERVFKGDDLNEYPKFVIVITYRVIVPTGTHAGEVSHIPGTGRL